MSPFFTIESAHFKGLQFVTVKSNALKMRADVSIFSPETDSGLPDGVPIVILLHGVYGSHWAWTMKGNVHKTAQTLIHEGKIGPMVLIMPSDGLFGDGSGYVPHRSANYEKWIVEDVIQVAKEQVPMVNDHSPIFIAGLSMGGFGAMRLGAKYPHLFKAFSGLSSITHFDEMRGFVSDFEGLKNAATEQDGTLDWLLKNRDILPPFRFDCGKDDVLIESNRILHKALISNKISHIYEEFSGGHSWDYWGKYIERTLIFFNHQTV